MPEYISPTISGLLLAYRMADEPCQDAEEERVKVNRVVSKLSFVYEKIRNTIDYQETHLLRKNAIERILKRKVHIERRKRADIALPLILELIRGGYIPNNSLPESKVETVKGILHKYFCLYDEMALRTANIPQRFKTFNWLLGVAAVEIENELVSPVREKALANAMYSIMNKDVLLNPVMFTDEEKNTQVYLSIQRALLKADIPMLRHLLLGMYLPEWGNPTEELVRRVAGDRAAYMDAIEDQIRHPSRDKLLKVFKKRSFSFHILRNIIHEYGVDGTETLFGDREALASAVKAACEKHYKQAKVVLRRSVARSIIYIFVTKMILAVALELPYEMFILGDIHAMPLSINLIFPPVLMLAVGATIRLPGQKNTDQAITDIEGIVYEDRLPRVMPKSRAHKKGPVMQAIYNVLYFATYVISFGVIILALNQLGFNIVSGILFVFFLSLVSFFGVKIRQPVRELYVIDKKESIFRYVIDFFSLPFVKAGRWLIEEFSKLNIFVFAFDFIIEAPFKTIIDVIEDWLSFMKDKKDDVY